MFSSIRHAITRASLRRPANVRTLTDSVASDALQHAAPNAGEANILSALSSSQRPAVASTSTSTARTAASSTDTANIHIPPAEDPLLHLFTSCVMKHGKRQEATRVTAKMLLHLHAFTKAPPLPIFREAIAKASPLLRCRQFKRAAKQYVFPMPLNERQRARQAIKWILDSSDKKGGKHLPERAAREVIAVIKGDSEVIKKKVDVHKLAVLHRYVRMPSSSSLVLILLCSGLQRQCAAAAKSTEVEPGLIWPNVARLTCTLSLIMRPIGLLRANTSFASLACLTLP